MASGPGQWEWWLGVEWSGGEEGLALRHAVLWKRTPSDLPMP